MTYEEAIRKLENILEEISEVYYITNVNEEPLIMAIKALEKQIPVPVATHTIFNDYLQAYERIRVCPVCGVNTPVPRALEIWEWWCPDCGQRLDWSKPKGDSYDFAIIDEAAVQKGNKDD